MKRLHRLSPKVRMNTDFFVMDTETGELEKDGWIHWKLKARPEAFQVGVIYGFNYCKVFHNRKTMIQHLQLDPRFKGKYVFAHNAEYDLTVLYDNIYKYDPNAIFNGRFIAATNGQCFFADSMNIFKTSVAELAKKLGKEKAKLGNAKMRSKTVDKGVINRCSTDCEIVWDALYSIFQQAGDIKITQASLSLIYYRRFHQPMHIDFDEKNVAHFWDSYYGGRTEVFKLGPTHSHVIDLNSAYPYAMKFCKFPNPKYLKVEKNITPQYLIKNLFPHYEGCVYATVKHKKTWIGYLPTKIDNKLCFPTGTFKGCWNFNELKFAIEQNVVEIKRITKVVYADRMASPFGNYVDSLYAERMACGKDSFEEYRIKIFMNSLYGKFAQRILEESIYIDDIKKRIGEIKEHQKRGTFKQLQLFNPKRNDAFLVVISSKGQHVSHSIPSFASYITSFTRIMVLKQLLKMKSCRPVYCDTDSIFYEIDKGFKNSYELGGWKKESKIVYQVDGLKNYHYKDLKKSDEMIHRIKGVPGKAKLVDTNTFEYYDLMKTKEALRRGLVAGVLTKRKKVITGKYDKRQVFAEGATKPIVRVESELIEDIWDD